MTAIIIGDLADLTITEINVCLCFITALNYCSYSFHILLPSVRTIFINACLY